MSAEVFEFTYSPSRKLTIEGPDADGDIKVRIKADDGMLSVFMADGEARRMHASLGRMLGI